MSSDPAPNDQPLFSVVGLRAKPTVEAGAPAASEILRGLDLTVRSGEVHAIMGPNGSGKSTLGNTLLGSPEYEMTAGTIELRGVDISEWSPDERARAGMFLAFQYPVEVPGVSNKIFLRAALNAVREYRGLDELEALVLTPELLASFATPFAGVAPAAPAPRPARGSGGLIGRRAVGYSQHRRDRSSGLGAHDRGTDVGDSIDAWSPALARCSRLAGAPESKISPIRGKRTAAGC